MTTASATLGDYLNTVTFEAGKAPTDSPVVDMVFFKVGFLPGLDLEVFLSTLEIALEGSDLPWPWTPGKEISYLELGPILGDQGLALAVMATGTHLGLWQLLTPYTVLGSTCPSELAKKMAGHGLVTVVVPTGTQSEPQK